MPPDGARQRKTELLAELERVEQEEHEEHTRRAAEEQERREADLDPKQKAVREEIERRAHDALDREWPPTWSPQQRGSTDPDELVGLVTRINPSVGPSRAFGTYSAVLEVKATDGREWTVWANHGGALFSQLVRLQIQPGEVVAIRYRGLKESSANPGQQYQDYRLVRVEDDEGEPQRVDYAALVESESGQPALPPPKQQEDEADDDIPF
jgi:hypothetical protein